LDGASCHRPRSRRISDRAHSRWAFDVSEAGITATPETVPADCPPAFAAGRKNIFALAAFGLLTAMAAGYFLIPRASARKLEKSIAVLPFDNFSVDKENAYFADGIQDDVLTNLARISDLKVISRTSVMPYRGQTHNLREIGKALNVATILEASVRRDGKRVRINVQLIDASNDRHLWAQVYDRELTDVFAIQSELAQEIASALKATLSPDEQQRIEKKPTENGESYLVYLEAKEIFNRPDRHHDDLARVEALYEKAVQLDPSFALAHARLSHLQSWSYYAIEPIAARAQKARTAANEALRLQPDLPESHLALGYVNYYVDRDYDRALNEFAVARRGRPNDAGVFRGAGKSGRRAASRVARFDLCGTRPLRRSGRGRKTRGGIAAGSEGRVRRPDPGHQPRPHQHDVWRHGYRARAARSVVTDTVRRYDSRAAARSDLGFAPQRRTFPADAVEIWRQILTPAEESCLNFHGGL
jgi:TolB-like protein